jgi:hypothetical protein
MILIEDGTKLSIQGCGSKCAICIEGPDPETIVRRFWSFWNNGATRGEFIWHHETRGHFWTTPDKLLKALTGAAFFKLYNKYDWFFGDDEERAERVALSLAKAEVARMPQVPWVVNVRENVIPHDVGMIGGDEFRDDEDPTAFHVRKLKGQNPSSELSWSQ